MNADCEHGGGLSSCFVIDIRDSVDGIFKAQSECARIYQYNGGVGFDISPLRPAKAPLTTAKGFAGGAVTFMQNFNAVADSMTRYNSRKSATKIDMQVWHPDIHEFIHCKDDGTSLPLMNISVGISDAFMKAVAADADWQLMFPDYERDKDLYNDKWDGDLEKWMQAGYPVKVYETLKARDLFREIAESAWKRGDPGVIFTNALNKKNPNKHIGKVKTSNPCAEFNSIPYTSCCLGSFNLTKYIDQEGHLDISARSIRHDVETAVRMLDNVITVNKYPLEEIKTMTQANRSIGIGVMGLADALYKMGIPYGSKESIQLTGNVIANITRLAQDSSRSLAEERGTYKNYPGSYWDAINIPMRNSDVTSTAPTGSISTICGVSSSIEPNFGLVYTRQTVEGNKLFVVNPVFAEELKKRGLYSDELLQKIGENHGSCQGITEIPEDMRRVYVTAHDLTPSQHIAMTAAVQSNISLSVSKTVNLPNSTTVDDVLRVYQEAFDIGLLGITVYRDGCRDNQVLTTGASNVNQETQSDERGLEWGDVIQSDDHVVGQKRKVRTACGNLHVLAYFDQGTGRVIELFTNRGGQGGCTALQSALSRMISRCLRLGDTPEAIQEQLQSTLQCPHWQAANIKRLADGKEPLSAGFSCASAIGGAIMSMQQEMNEEICDDDDAREDQAPVERRRYSRPECPQCGQELANDGGCMVCNACGWSKCG